MKFLLDQDVYAATARFLNDRGTTLSRSLATLCLYKRWATITKSAGFRGK